MKNVLVVLLCGIIFSGCASVETLPPEQRQFQKVYELENMSKDVIYNKSLSWIAENFRSAKAVIELQDKENGKIVGHGIITIIEHGNFGITIPVDTKFTLIIDIKDTKVRLTYQDLILISVTGNKELIPEERDMVAIKEKLESLSTNYFNYITKKDKSW